ncbi:hypothetical protein AU467_22530 [Mesorhizobium loti]|uniref:Uncharacterized protein n=1 Tax=Rhizobium loti TaxID=381 RepID=A0A101KSP5_RHILI|nr:hypothetical protein AU467_22530 [Mesorhizobium loti]
MGIIRASALALALATAGLAAGYVWLPPGLFELNPAMDFGERIAFALKVDLLVFIWLAGCVGAVSRGRFYWPADIRGLAFGRRSSLLIASSLWPRKSEPERAERPAH